MLYDFMILLVSGIARVMSLFDDKIKRFFHLRKGEILRVENFFRDKRSKRIFWFHSASSGEFEQAKPVIEYIKKNNRDILIAASFYSPSGYDAGIKFSGADFCFNLPLDSRKNVKRLLAALKPEIIVFSKYDVWANLVNLASRQGIGLFLINGTLPRKSCRHRFPLKIFLRRSYSLIDRIYAISEDDAGRFLKITGGPRGDKLIAAGDARYDRVYQVVKEDSGKHKPMIKREKGILYFIAGSTYEKTEKILLPVIKMLNKAKNNIRFIIVPHEVDSHNIIRIKKLIHDSGLVPLLLSSSKTPMSPCREEILVVDKMGLLAVLYGETDIVFIGGSFKGSVHSVLEPAVFGRPILTGPFIGNSFEALELSKGDGLIICKDGPELHRAILRLISDKDYRKRAGECSRAFFMENLGAAEFIINDLKKLADFR